MPPKEAKSKPWDVLCLDLIEKHQFTPKGGGQKYQMTTKNGKTVYLQAVSMIDPAKGSIETRKVPSASADLASNKVQLGMAHKVSTTYQSHSRLWKRILSVIQNHDSSQLRYCSKAYYFKKPTS